MPQSSQVSRPNISDELYSELLQFIISEVQKGPTDPRNGGVYAQTLTKIYLDRYLDQNRLEDEVYVKGEKKLILKLLWWLVEERVLKLVKRVSGGTGFVIDPDYKAEDPVPKGMDLGFIRLRGANCASEQQPSEDEEVIGIIEKKKQVDEEQPLDQTNDSDEQEDARDAEITRVDSPIPSASVSPIHSTPSKKRRVPDVIAENDASSRGSSSPEYGPDRASKRIATPKHIRCQSDGRYSVESTSNHANTPQRRNYTESNATPIPLKLESKLKDPDMVKLLTKLRSRYPMDHIDICSKDGFLECKNCEKSYKAWTTGANPKPTANNMINHLRSKAHRDMARMARAFNPITTSTSSYPTGQFQNPASMQPVQVYSMPNIDVGWPSKGDSTQQALNGTRTSLFQFKDVIEKNTPHHTQRTKTLEEKLSVTEVLNRDNAEKMSKLMIALQMESKAQNEVMDRKLATCEAQSRTQAARMDRRFLETEQKLQHEVDELKEKALQSDDMANKRAEQLGEKLVKSETTTVAELVGLREKVASCNVRSEEQHRAMTKQMTMLENEKKFEYKEMTDRITSLVEANEEQGGEFNRIGGTLQVHTDALTVCHQNEAELRRTIAAYQMENAQRLEQLEKETSERLSAAEQASAEKVRAIEQATTERIKALRKENASRIESVEQETSGMIRQIEYTYAAKIISLTQQIAGHDSQIRELSTEKDAQTRKFEKLNIVFPKLIEELEVYHSIVETFVKYATNQHTCQRKPTSPRLVKNRRSSIRQMPRRERKFTRLGIVKRRRSSMKRATSSSRASTFSSS